MNNATNSSSSLARSLFHMVLYLRDVHAFLLFWTHSVLGQQDSSAQLSSPGEYATLLQVSSSAQVCSSLGAQD